MYLDSFSFELYALRNSNRSVGFALFYFQYLVFFEDK